jgi:hypothetical protein
MGIHPSAASSSKDCVFCFSCVKSCQHRSVRVDARYPWQELLRKEKWELSSALFAVFLTASVLTIKLPESWLCRRLILHEPAGSPSLMTDVCGSLMVLIAFVALPLLASGIPFRKEGQRHFTHAGHAYLFLAFSGFFNIYLHEFVYNGHNLLPWAVHLFTFGTFELPDALTPNLGTLKALFPLITLAGGIPSLLMLRILANKYSFPNWLYRGHQMVLFLCILLFLLVL